MSSVRKTRVNPEPPHGPSTSAMLSRIQASPTDGEDTAAEVAWRAEVARDCDPADPLKGKMLRAAACEAIRVRGADLAALGLPVAADVEPEPDGDTFTAPHGASLKLTGADKAAGDRKPLPASTFKNAEAEEGMLSGMMADNGVIAEALDVAGPEDFAYPQFRVICRAVKDLHGAGKPVDAANVVQELVGTALLDMACGPETVKSIAEAKVPRDRTLSHAQIVRTNADLRNSMIALDAIKKQISGSRTVGAAEVAQIREIVDRIGAAPGDNDEQIAASPNWPAPAGEAVWHGVLGEIVGAIAPETEADPVSLLTQLLVCFGNVIGRNAHWVVNATRHYCNLNAVVTGPSGQGLKGTSWNIVRDVIGGIDLNWRRECLQFGLVSGEGMIYFVRDAVTTGKEPDLGVSDKRSLWIESEFTKTIGCMGRDGSTLSEVICQAFDGDCLRSSSKNCPTRATDPHVSVIAHTTITAIRKTLGEAAKTNGFANRFLWVCSRRSKELPFGGDLRSINLRSQGRRLAKAISFASDPNLATNPVGMDGEARELYGSVYSRLIRTRAGVAAPILDRAAPLVRRLAVIYAMLDLSKEVKAVHLKAALAFWDYCERSVQFVFGDAQNDEVSNTILDALRGAKEKGIPQNDVNKLLFHGDRAKDVARSLDDLAAAGLVEHRRVKGRGRPALVWYIAGYAGGP